MKAFITYLSYLIIVYVLVIFCFLTFDSELVTTSTSPDKSCEIIIRSDGGFLFSGPNIYVFYKNGLLKHLLFKTELANEGSSIRIDNYDIIWTDNIAKITFIGEKLFPEIYIVDCSNKVTYKEIRNRYDRTDNF